MSELEQIFMIVLVVSYGAICYVAGKGDFFTLVAKMMQNWLEEVEEEINKRSDIDV